MAAEEPKLSSPLKWLLLGCGGTLLLIACALCGLFLIGLFASETADQATPTPALGAVPYQAVVQIVTLYYDENRTVQEGWWGSGSIISPDGLILTNAHVVLPEKNFPVDLLKIGLTVSQDEPPHFAYFAEVLQADAELDIAVIRITHDINGKPIDPATLNLPTIPLGDSTTLQLGDKLNILGYPGIGGETITLTTGEVSGFTPDPRYGPRAFIKTSATIAGGNSGGAAVNERGELIGVPTQLGSGSENLEMIDCRRLADTNRDGQIDENDQCVPVGGFINAIRPLQLTLPYIQAAQRGERRIVQPTPKTVPLSISGHIFYEEDFSSPSSGWSTHETETSTIQYQNGQYVFALHRENWIVFSPSPVEAPDADVTLQVEASVLNSSRDGDYGLICRAVDPQNFYYLTISEDGYFSIWKQEKGEWSILLDWEKSDLIPTTAGQRVTLTAKCQGNSLQLGVNGQLLGEVEDNTFPDARGVGLAASTANYSDLRLAFDNFRLISTASIQRPPTKGKVLFQDNFDAKKSWFTHQDEESVREYTQGGYRLLVKTTQLQIWSLAEKRFTDVVVEVDTRRLGGPLNNTLGLICRYRDHDNFYFAEIANDGYALIGAFKNDKFVALADWKRITFIKQDENHLRLDCVGDRLTLYVNDRLALEATDDTHKQGDVGVTAGTFDEPGTDILFDNFVVYAP